MQNGPSSPPDIDATTPSQAPTPAPVSAQPVHLPRPPSPQEGGGERSLVEVLAYGLLVTLAWYIVSLYGLGRAPFHTKGEPREALVVWEMTHGGGWILPMSNGELVPSKPPLLHWIGAITSFLRGATDEWSIRFPSALLSLLSLWGVLLAGSSLWNPRVGLLSSLLLMTTFEWARSATHARVDMALTFGLQSAFFCLLFFLRDRSHRWLVPLYVSIAIAVLGKGFVGAVLPGLVAAAMIVARRDWGLLRELRLPRGLVIVLGIAGLWYVLALFVGGSSFFRKQLLGEQIYTFLDTQNLSWRGHRHSLLYLPGALCLGLLPWTPFVLAAGHGLWRERAALRAADPRIYLLVWIAVVFFFYEAASSKRSVYLLALYPALALLLGAWWQERMQPSGPFRDAYRWLAQAASWLGRLLFALLLTLALILLLQGLGVPLVDWIGPWLSRSARLDAPAIAVAVDRDAVFLGACLGVSLLACAGLRRAGRAGHWGGILASLWIASVAVQGIVRVSFLPAIAERHSYRDMMREIRAKLGEDAPLHFYETFEYGAVYYAEGHIPTFSGDLINDGPRHLLMRRSTWLAIEEASKGTYERSRLDNDKDAMLKDPLILAHRLAPPGGPNPSRAGAAP